MNAAFQCIILLACAAVCFSSALPHCQCIKTIKAVNPMLIAAVTEYDPRPYCRKQEVIVTLKDGKLRCLDPKQEFTQKLLQRARMQRMTRADKVNTIRPKTTAASATETATASATATATATVLPTSP